MEKDFQGNADQKQQWISLFISDKSMPTEINQKKQRSLHTDTESNPSLVFKYTTDQTDSIDTYRIFYVPPQNTQSSQQLWNFL
jgi:hypothetical protein